MPTILADALNPSAYMDRAAGVPRETRAATIRRFRNAMGARFKELAVIDAPYGIPSPGNDPSPQPGGKYAGYFTAYASAHGAAGTPPPRPSAAAARCRPTRRCAPRSTGTPPSVRLEIGTRFFGTLAVIPAFAPQLAADGPG